MHAARHQPNRACERGARGVASSMQLDAVTFRTIAKRILSPASALTSDEAVAVIHAAQVTAGVDRLENAEEQSLLRQVARHVAAIAGVAPDAIPPASPLPLDDEEWRAWIDRLAGALHAPGASELAYVLAYLVTIADVEIAPVESSFLDELRAALGIDRDRAADLVVMVSSLVTPGLADEARRVG